jgi:GT2 family glycosyltransferase
VSVELTVAIPTFEGDPALLRRVLGEARGQAPGEVVVVDMSRTSVVVDACAEIGGITLIRLPESRGVSQSRNACIAAASTRHVLFLDSDALPGPGWATAMAAGFDQERVAIVGARVLPDWDSPPSYLMRTATASDWLSMFDLGTAALEVPRVMGTSYAIDRERVGDAPFDERLGRAPGVALGHEEVRLALDAQAAGWRCWYAADAVVQHHLPSDRATWRALLRRAFVAGQETRLERARLAPLPRRMTAADHVFRAAVAPAFLLGRALGPRLPAE